MIRTREVTGKVLMLCALLLCSSAIFAIGGKIVDSDGDPVSSASVSDSRHSTYSREDGSFYLATEADSLHIHRLGFHDRTISTRDLKAPVVLVRDDIVLPSVWVRAIEYRPNSPSLNSSIIHPDTNAGINNSNDLLLQNPAFVTTDTRLSGERQTVSILGSFSRHSLVMLDGVVLNPAGEAFDLSRIPIGQISHIEVIKGNSSVYGGSAAIGGIIHIHTKKADDARAAEAEIYSSMGSFGLYKQAYRLLINRDALSLKAEYMHHTALNNFTYKTPDFWGIEPELEREHNKKTGDSFYAKARYSKDASELSYSINMGSFVRQLPGTINFLDLYDNSKLTGNYAQHNLRGILSHRDFAHELLLWWNRDFSIFTNQGSTNTLAKSHYDQTQQSRGLKLSNNLNLEETKLGVNAEYSTVDYDYFNRLSNIKTTGERDNSAIAVQAQQVWYPGIMSYKALGAFRADYCEDKVQPSWRLEQELQVPLGFELTIGGYVGTAYSQPSLFDMYWIGDSETQGNPNLKSESSFGYNMYAEANTGKARWKIAYYQNLVENLIQWRQYYLNGISWKPFNVGKARIRNYEFETQMQISRLLKVNAGVTFTDAKDVARNSGGIPSPSYNKKLVYTPAMKAVAMLNFGNDIRGCSLQYNYTGEQYSTVDNMIAPLKGFDTLDTAGFYRIGLRFIDIRCDLRVNNILNKMYEIYAYTPQPGINWETGISISTKNYRAKEQVAYEP
ncbi:MAG: TonB-dependent receptor [Candidatus Cloacimonetes bacterium]|nr:TonB-dependent receptor [Candidatus Cloacimonadota bacterium]MDD2506392.1 TonB-dependent receptor [Candidatus Cloacimonadota bacterium]MDD4559797.1 TonB-dependent receptor [Candidatus Cloacimonadota bacterium]